MVYTLVILVEYSPSMDARIDPAVKVGNGPDQKIDRDAEVGRSRTSGKVGIGYPTVVLLTVTVAVLLINYVETMVIPGVPEIQKELAASSTVASWITSAFLIVGAAVAPLFGRLGDIYGKKRMLLIVLLFYVVGVGLAGFAPTMLICWSLGRYKGWVLRSCRSASPWSPTASPKRK